MFCHIAVPRFRSAAAAIILTFRTWLFILCRSYVCTGDSAVYIYANEDQRRFLYETAQLCCVRVKKRYNYRGWLFSHHSSPFFSSLPTPYAHARGASSQWHRLRVCRAPRRPQRYHRWINMTLLSGPLPDKHSRINIQIERRECSALETPKGETACTRVPVSCPRRCLDLDVASRQGKFLRRITLSAKSLLIAIAMAPSVDNVFAIRVDERNVNWNEHASQDLHLHIV